MGGIEVQCFKESLWEAKQVEAGEPMRKMTLIYWKDGDFWLGKLRERPEIMTQGKTLAELEENIRDAYELMVMDEVPGEYQTKEIAL